MTRGYLDNFDFINIFLVKRLIKIIYLFILNTKKKDQFIGLIRVVPT